MRPLKPRLLQGAATVAVVAAVLGYGVYRDRQFLTLDPPRPRYHLKDDTNRGVIVFVHGIAGRARTTWLNTTREPAVYWPDLIKADPAFAGFNIFLHEYYTPRAADGPSVDQLAEHMHDEFLSARLFEHDEIVFLTHGIGGLISKAFIVRYQKEYAPKTKLMFFYATPALGPDLANVFSLLTRTPDVGDVASIGESTDLADQLRKWINAGPQVPSYCAYEQVAWKSRARVVDIGSASAMCGKRLSGITADHEDIVKPRDTDDVRHKVFRTAFEEVHAKAGTFKTGP